MRTDFKYLGQGLVLGVSGAALLLGGFFFFTANWMEAPQTNKSILSKTPESYNTLVLTTPSFTPTPTMIIHPTSTPLITHDVTASSTPKDMITELFNSGHIFLTGPLTKLQQVQLYITSLDFRRGNTNDARILGETFNGHGYGAPSDICGPLSIAILQSADLLDKSIKPHDFWLLNPDVTQNRKLLNSVFSPERYENHRFKFKLNSFNWRDYPLYPGDFIYIYSGTGGNFEHMLVVNRVDSQLRTYAVTNYNTPDGFIINEVLLYDPADPRAGIFKQWTTQHFNILGSTGFDGFELWRLHRP